MPAHDPDRLQHVVRVDAAGHVLGLLALEEVGSAGGELHHLDAALERPRAASGSVLPCSWEMSRARSSRLPPRAARGTATGCGPAAAGASRHAGQRGLRGRHRPADLVGAGERGAPDHLAGGGIEDVAGAAAGAVHFLPAIQRGSTGAWSSGATWYEEPPGWHCAPRQRGGPAFPHDRPSPLAAGAEEGGTGSMTTLRDLAAWDQGAQAPCGCLLRVPAYGVARRNTGQHSEFRVSYWVWLLLTSGHLIRRSRRRPGRIPDRSSPPLDAGEPHPP